MMDPLEETANMEGAAGSKAPKGQNADHDAVLNAHMQQEHEEEVEAGALVSEASAASVMTAHDEGAVVVRRGVKRRGHDETVNRSVDIHFPHLTASERLNKTDGAGLNIRQRISKDKKALKKGQRLSSAYYRDLALEYPADDPVQSLEPKSAGEQVAPRIEGHAQQEPDNLQC